MENGDMSDGQLNASTEVCNCEMTILTFQIFSGNTDSDTVITHDLDPPITAKYLRFRPITWGSRIGMRAEVYGFKGNNTCCSINSMKNT
ncbi:unnamed protein product [Porites evermanni]|uniref:F5/8 type C domain-containing protein n=1 Tax=Porites evermanni TaxID=104178 RepID=A0ABN8SYQ7_9CNID|nr:unnamed protein product [Porites evermanni]